MQTPPLPAVDVWRVLPLSAATNTISVVQLLAGHGDDMARERFQDPVIQATSRGRHYIRPWVDVIKNGNITRQKKRFYLEAAGERLGQRELMKRKKAVMDTINRADYVIQAQINFGEFLDYYLQAFVDKKNQLSVSTQGKYNTHIKNHIRPAFGTMMLCELTTKVIQAWIDSKAEKLSWATCTDLRNIMSGIFTKAEDWGHWKERNPVARVHVGRKRAVREHRKLTTDEMRRLLAALPDDVRLICWVALSMALRISEVLGIQWKHVDFAAGVIHIRQRYYRGDIDVPKSEKGSRDIQMGYLADELQRMYPGPGSEEEFVFSVKTKRGISRDDRDINQHFLRPAAQALGIYWKGFGFHSFRREAITELMSMLGLDQVQRMAGHANPRMTLQYVLTDLVKQEEMIRKHQLRILGEGGSIQ